MAIYNFPNLHPEPPPGVSKLGSHCCFHALIKCRDSPTIIHLLEHGAQQIPLVFHWWNISSTTCRQNFSLSYTVHILFFIMIHLSLPISSEIPNALFHATSQMAFIPKAMADCRLVHLLPRQWIFLWNRRRVPDWPLQPYGHQCRRSILPICSRSRYRCFRARLRRWFARANRKVRPSPLWSRTCSIHHYHSWSCENGMFEPQNRSYLHP